MREGQYQRVRMEEDRGGGLQRWFPLSIVDCNVDIHGLSHDWFEHQRFMLHLVPFAQKTLTFIELIRNDNSANLSGLRGLISIL
jgi:hypothetical protein